jgi:hypoxanthine phosphoribosyltransferase
MQADIDRILIPRRRIAARVTELAAQITADHSASGGDAEMTIVAIMTGALVFCGDLIRQIPIAMKMGLMMVSSYRGAGVRGQEIQVLGRHLGDVHGHNVLLIDDVLDSGKTISHVKPMLLELGAVQVRTCVLLRKDRPAARAVAVEYVGFDIPDEFVVGYGLDYNHYYRNLPDIVTLKNSVLQAAMRREAGEEEAKRGTT